MIRADLTDAVNQVIELSDFRIQPPPAFGTRVQPQFLRGLGEGEGGFILLLDIRRLMTTEELLTVYPSLVEPNEGPAPAPPS
jgi:purine-binding chemotaxis protein CheW